MKTLPRQGEDTERVPFAQPEISLEARQAAARVLASGWVTTGPQVAEFEREFAASLGASHAVAVSSCTAAIEISLRSLGLRPGARVLTSTLTFCGAVHAILHAGLQPVLVDVNPDTLMPDAETTAAAVREFGPADAMLVLHFAGDPAPVEELAEAAGLPLARVVEDAAHALGSTVGSRPVGTISAATCFSFYATKNLAIGEGGMITTDDGEIADHARRCALHGMSRDAWRRYQPGGGWRYSVDGAGLKANMTDLQAAIGRAQLGHMDRWQRRRAELADRYTTSLASIPGIATPQVPTRGGHAWHLYVVRVGREFGMHRDLLVTRLGERGIDCSVHFIPIHHHRYFQLALGPRPGGGLPGADGVFEQIVSLPLYPALRDDQVDRVCAEIADLQRAPHPVSPSVIAGGIAR
jgi:dTDP-4-amino-4,6-dideoxygalactose transaminase